MVTIEHVMAHNRVRKALLVVHHSPVRRELRICHCAKHCSVVTLFVTGNETIAR